MEKREIEVAGATVPFYEYEKDGLLYFEFDSSSCEHPGPMINAMSGLKLLDNQNKRLVMINHKEPMGLYNKIEGNFNWKSETLDNGLIKIVFTPIDGKASQTDFTQTSCCG